MKESGSLGLVVACTVGVALLITILVDDGWLVWIPVLLALATIQLLRRRWTP